MNRFKCKGCDQGFSTDRGLSTHFQHKYVCKSVHYAIKTNLQDNTFPPLPNSIVTKTDTQSTVQKSHIGLNNASTNNADSSINDINHDDNSLNPEFVTEFDKHLLDEE